LALQESLPTKPLPLPQLAPHLLQLFSVSHQQLLQGSIDMQLQNSTYQIIDQQLVALGSRVKNAAVLVTDNTTGKFLVYIGNAAGHKNNEASFVDCALAPRSTGSILKPFLFASAMQDGLITPQTLLPDMPMQFGSFNPKNYAKTYSGAVPASKALSQSLNIPFVYLLNEYGVQKQLHTYKQLGFTHLNKHSSYYGLSLILGGGEESLYNLHKAYTALAIQLNKNVENPNVIFDNAVIYETFNAMQEVNRPDELGSWKVFEHKQQIAWKTGTSFGNRDAWAIGVTPKYTVSVWVGNASGEADNALTGFKAAAPILFSVFNCLPKNATCFEQPLHCSKRIAICTASGMRANAHCPTVDTLLLPNTCSNSAVCNHHIIVANNNELFTSKIIFDMPASMAKYYHPNALQSNNENLSKQECSIIYPLPNKTIHITRNSDGSINPILFEALANIGTKQLIWYLNNECIGTTVDIHQLKFLPKVGHYHLKVVTREGQFQSVQFSVAG
jgi:penicillin-binding protein 1C